MAKNTSSTGGFIVQALETFDEKYRCLICNYMLKSPSQLGCGHRVCYSCIEALMKKTNEYQCVVCKEATNLSEVSFDKGFQRDMFILDVACYLCEWCGKLKVYQEHLEQMHREFQCEFCSQICSSQSAMEEHKKQSCTKVPLTCQLYDFGCTAKFLRDERRSHYASEEHQRTVLARLEQLQSKGKQTKQGSGASTSETMEVDALEQQAGSSLTAGGRDVVSKVAGEMQNLNEIIDLVANGVDTLQKNLLDVNTDASQQLQAGEQSEQEITTVQKSIEESNSLLGAMHTNVALLQQNLMALKQKYDEEQTTSYNGTLLWKITGVQEKMADAKSERQVSIYSPAFRSSPTGYKMCARLYLYGDGNARRTHMSLFFVLMRGQHDPILRFPFEQKVTFCLYDQSSSRRHMIDSFRPDTRSSSFQRPRSDMNIASGVPKFASLSIFDLPGSPYVKDDTMFIKVLVDFENTTKTMIPFALSLNPGLPLHVQQRLIQKEIEKRSTQTQTAVQGTTA